MMLEPTDSIGWRPPRWQLLTPLGTYDFERKPRNPLVRLIWYMRGYRWRVNPALTSFGSHR